MSAGPRTRQRRATLFALVAACAMASCGGLPERAQQREPARAVAADSARKAALPKIVAVMPFRNQTRVEDAAERVRKSVYNLLNSKPFVDVELAYVDEQVVLLERATGKRFSELGASEICRALGCDGLLYGTVTDYTRTFAGIYSHLGASAELWLVNANTGEEVMRAREAVDYYEGSIPLSPLAAVMTALSAAANVTELQELRMLGDLAAKLVARIPLPEGAPAIRRPVIKELITNAAQGPFGRGSVVRVGLDGEPGIVAAFDIGNFRRGLPLKETQPGVYLGEYAILPGDNTADMPIVAYLKRPSGPESQWIDASARVVIDTTPPDRVTGLRARASQDRITLSWEYSPDLADLSGFLVMRSQRPLSGYEELGKVETTGFEDRSAKPETDYHYRVIALDRAGNRSEPAQTVAARLATQGPALLSGETKGDTVLSGIHILKGRLVVPRGAWLRVGPETSLMAEAGARIVVEGRLTIDGESGMVRLFSRSTEKWKGIEVRGGQAQLKGFLLSGAETGLALYDANGVIENAAIVDNGVGIHIAGNTETLVRNCWLAGNTTGIELFDSGAKILQSVIVRNTTGLALRNFSGEVRENIIADNGKNIVSDYPLKLDPNYLGLAPDRGTLRTAGYR